MGDAAEEVVKETLSSITEEIISAHTESLDALSDIATDPVGREAFKRLHRTVETWELELLASNIGRGIDLDTFTKVGGALAAFRLMKELLNDLGTQEGAAKKKVEDRAHRFTASLKGSPSKPV
jgi:hypothetical protein